MARPLGHLLGISGATAIEGLTNATNGDSAIAGIQLASGGGGAGVYGSSSAGSGVYGVSTAGQSPGVAGFQLGTSSNAGNAFYGESADVYGGYPVIQAQGDNPGTWLFYASNLATTGYCWIRSRWKSGAAPGRPTSRMCARII